jgi:hypothetical protein
MNGTVQGVLNWDHRSVTFSVYDRKENFFEGLQWDQNGTVTCQLICGNLAERPELSLECDSALQPILTFEFEFGGPFQRLVFSSGNPSRSITRSTLESIRSSMVSGWL